MILELVLLGAVLLWLLLKLWNVPYRYWELRGFPYIPGRFPFGSSKELVIFTEYQGLTTEKMCKKMSGHPFFGVYLFRKAGLVVQDPDMIRLVLTKDFQHFRDRQSFRRNHKEILSQHLFNLEGERWRSIRTKLTPTFTSGKLKMMFPLFVSCTQELDNLLLSKLDKIIDIKDITCSFTSDTICLCAFGIEVNALSNPDSEFKNLGIDIFKNDIFYFIKLAMMNVFPFIEKIYVPRFLPGYMEKFLLNIIKETIELRKKNGSRRNDFIDLLMQLNEKGTLESEMKDHEKLNYGTTLEMTYEMMTAQCFVFFAAGFETSASVQSYCLYEMALNSDIQERVHKEIVDTIETHGDVTYQAIMDMTYLDMVVHETMRKYPTIPILTRVCTKKYSFPNDMVLEEGTLVIIPVYALHHNPSYFSEPEVFDPERFSAQNKQNIKPYTYLPFGEGPRNCIGMRFGLLQTKMGLITLLRKYRIERADCTSVPLQLRGTSLITTVASPIKLKIVKRNP